VRDSDWGDLAEVVEDDTKPDWPETWWGFTFGEDRAPEPLVDIHPKEQKVRTDCGQKCPIGTQACIEEGFCIVAYEQWSVAPHVWPGDNG
jgi:hypothetical protein